MILDRSRKKSILASSNARAGAKDGARRPRRRRRHRYHDRGRLPFALVITYSHCWKIALIERMPSPGILSALVMWRVFDAEHASLVSVDVVLCTGIVVLVSDSDAVSVSVSVSESVSFSSKASSTLCQLQPQHIPLPLLSPLAHRSFPTQAETSRDLVDDPNYVSCISLLHITSCIPYKYIRRDAIHLPCPANNLPTYRVSAGTKQALYPSEPTAPAPAPLTSDLGSLGLSHCRRQKHTSQSAARLGRERLAVCFLSALT